MYSAQILLHKLIFEKHSCSVESIPARRKKSGKGEGPLPLPKGTKVKGSHEALPLAWRSLKRENTPISLDLQEPFLLAF